VAAVKDYAAPRLLVGEQQAPRRLSRFCCPTFFFLSAAISRTKASNPSARLSTTAFHWPAARPPVWGLSGKKNGSGGQPKATCGATRRPYTGGGDGLSQHRADQCRHRPPSSRQSVLIRRGEALAHKGPARPLRHRQASGHRHCVKRRRFYYTRLKRFIRSRARSRCSTTRPGHTQLGGTGDKMLRRADAAEGGCGRTPRRRFGGYARRWVAFA